MKTIKKIIGWILLFMILPLIVGIVFSPFHLFSEAFTIMLMIEILLVLILGAISFLAFLVCKYLIGNWN